MNNVSGNREKVNEGMKDVADKMHDGMKDMAGKVADKTQELKEQVEEYSENVTEYIKKCPIKSVAIASAAGIVLGLLMKK
jgi:ElaB/YqjD/DUF883 family membrane-anchored ribosome-binding protein